MGVVVVKVTKLNNKRRLHLLPCCCCGLTYDRITDAGDAEIIPRARSRISVLAVVADRAHKQLWIVSTREIKKDKSTSINGISIIRSNGPNIQIDTRIIFLQDSRWMRWDRVLRIESRWNKLRRGRVTAAVRCGLWWARPNGTGYSDSQKDL